MVFESQYTKSGVSPVIGVLLLVLVSVILSVSIAPFVLESVSEESSPYGVEVSFEEDETGSVTVIADSTGNAERIYVKTNYSTNTITSTNEKVKLVPGEGTITVIAEKNGENVSVQSYEPINGPSTILSAEIETQRRVSPREEITVTSNESKGSITNYYWDIDSDGDSEFTGKSFSTSFSDSGIANIQLTVETSSGATDSKNTSIIVSDVIVSRVGNGDYISINNAISNAQSGDSIYIESSEKNYNEYISVDKPGLTLFSNNSVTLNGSSITGDSSGFDISASQVTVRGFKIFNYTTGINIDGNQTVIESSYITKNGNRSTNNSAVMIHSNTHDVHIKNSQIAGNKGTCGIQIGTNTQRNDGSDNLTIENSIVSGNIGNGLCVHADTKDLLIKNSTLSYNTESGAKLESVTNFTISNSKFSYNSAGLTNPTAAVYITNSSNGVLKESTLQRNQNTGLEITDNSSKIDLTDSQYIRNMNSGISITGGTTKVYLDNLNVSNNTNSGLVISESYNTTINNSTFIENKKDGIYVSYPVTNIGGNVKINQSILVNNSNTDLAVRNQNGTINAKYNWWGQPSGPTAGQVTGPVNSSNPCDESTC